MQALYGTLRLRHNRLRPDAADHLPVGSQRRAPTHQKGPYDDADTVATGAVD
jgi:hypothetical protein